MVVITIEKTTVNLNNSGVIDKPAVLSQLEAVILIDSTGDIVTDNDGEFVYTL